MDSERTTHIIRTAQTALALASLGLAACGGGSSPGKYSIGGTVSGLRGTLELRSGTGSDYTAHADGGFAFPSSVPSGTPYEVTVITQPEAQTCTVANGSGVATANVTDIAVDCRIDVGSGRFAYTTDRATSTVNVHTVDVATGGFSIAVGPPVGTGGSGVCALRMHPTGQFLYAQNTDSVAGFSLDPATGALAPVAGSPFAAGPVSGPMVLDKSGSYLYMFGAAGAIVGFRIDLATGVLRPLPTSPFSVNYGPMPASPIDLATNGDYLYVVDEDSEPAANYKSRVVSLKIDPASGSLSPAGAYWVDAYPASLVFSKDEAFAYASAMNFPLGSIGVYAVDAQTGALTDTGQHPEVDGLTGAIVFDARQAYLLAPIAAFTLLGGHYYPSEAQSIPVSATTGGIDGTVQHSAELSDYPVAVKTDPADRFLYVQVDTGAYAFVIPFDAATGALGVPGSPPTTPACDLVFY